MGKLIELPFPSYSRQKRNWAGHLKTNRFRNTRP
jgi:hypothetical protein